MMDDALFDPGQFQAELAIKSSPIAAFKKAIRQAEKKKLKKKTKKKKPWKKKRKSYKRNT